MTDTTTPAPTIAQTIERMVSATAAQPITVTQDRGGLTFNSDTREITNAYGTQPAAAGTSIDQRLTNCEPLTIREFLAYLYAQNYTKSTTARKLATLRSFYKCMIRRGLTSVNPL